jgi:hypothetical protein
LLCIGISFNVKKIVREAAVGGGEASIQLLKNNKYFAGNGQEEGGCLKVRVRDIEKSQRGVKLVADRIAQVFLRKLSHTQRKFP